MSETAIAVKVETVPDVAQPPTDGAVILSMIDKLIARPDVPVEKLEQMFALHQKVQAEAARRAFLVAFAELQAELPAAERKGKGHNDVSYARYEDVATALREPFARHGFSHWFAIDQTNGKVTVTTCLGHAAGHVETTDMTLPLDDSGKKTAMHALGSTVSYGKRYGLLTITGIATSDDDDGKAAIRSSGSQFVSDEQVAELIALITETNTDINAFLEIGGVESLSDIPANQFQAAKGKLLAKKAQVMNAASK